jgi:hypothetical protein
MALDDLAAYGQADTSPLIFVTAVEPLEDIEDPVRVFWVKSDSVVLYYQSSKISVTGVLAVVPIGSGYIFAINIYDWRFIDAVKLERIAD